MAAKKDVTTLTRPVVAAKVVPVLNAVSNVEFSKAAAFMAAPANIAPTEIVAKIAAVSVVTPAKAVIATDVESPVDQVAVLPSIAETPIETNANAPIGRAVVLADITNHKTKGKVTMENAIKSTEEFVSFGQGNVEAVMKSGQIWATGLQDLSKTFAATAQASIDETMATIKTLSSVKSLKEALDIQSNLAKTAMEKMMAESGKLTEASRKLAEQALAPLTARVTLAAEKFGRTA